MQNQAPLVNVPMAGAVPASAGAQPALPPDPTATMPMTAMPLQGQPGSAQSLAQPGQPVHQWPQANGTPQMPGPMYPNGQPMYAPPQNTGYQMPPATQYPAYFQPPPPPMMVAPPPAQPGQPIPITAENLAALGYVPGVPQQPAQVLAPQPAPQPAAAPATPPVSQPAPNGQANGQVGAPPALDIVRSEKPEIQALLNKQRDQLTQAFESANARANMAETERLRAERQDAINLANQHAAAATQARQSYELASALMNSGQNLQPNAQALVEAQVAPLLAQGVPAQQALMHVLQTHPYLMQAQTPQAQQSPADAQLLGIADNAPGTQPQQGVQQPQFAQQPYAGQVQQMPQAPMFGQPVQAVFQQPTTGFLGQPMSQMGGQQPVQPGQQPAVDLRSASPKEFRDWKFANGIQP